MKTPNTQAGRQLLQGFTLTDLLVLVATLAVLAMVVMPALAGVQNKGGRLECANNLRQIGAESMIYASENNGWLPICNVGAGNDNGENPYVFNHLDGVHYSLYVVSGAFAYEPISTNLSPGLGIYQNAGYLYHAGLAGNGNIFYCPAQWGDSADGANVYTPLLTADGSGFVRSSYFYNPRLLNPAVNDPIRRYQTTSQLEPHRLFAVDSFINLSGTGISTASIQHARDHGWNVLLTDGSVQFSRLTQSNNSFYNLITQDLTSGENIQSSEEYDEAFTWLEQDH
jgi:type II secretory pathway pseudopilin PulG